MLSDSVIWMEMTDGPYLPYIFPITKSIYTATNLHCIRHNVPLYSFINLRLYNKLLKSLYYVIYAGYSLRKLHTKKRRMKWRWKCIIVIIGTKRRKYYDWKPKWINEWMNESQNTSLKYMSSVVKGGRQKHTRKERMRNKCDKTEKGTVVKWLLIITWRENQQTADTPTHTDLAMLHVFCVLRGYSLLQTMPRQIPSQHYY